MRPTVRDGGVGKAVPRALIASLRTPTQMASSPAAVSTAGFGLAAAFATRCGDPASDDVRRRLGEIQQMVSELRVRCRRGTGSSKGPLH